MDTTSIIQALALIPGIGPYLVYLPLLIAICKIITVVFPAPIAGSKWLGVYKLVSAIALNFGNARNAVPPGLPPSVAAQVEAAAVVTAAVPAAAAATEAAQILVSAESAVPK